jgi:hypothetical protein
MTESVGPPVEEALKGRQSVEIYRSVYGKYSWKVTALAVDDSEQALRAAKALALDLEAEIYGDIAQRVAERKRAQ